jgi:Flp pilus assembly pilin Flp
MKSEKERTGLQEQLVVGLVRLTLWLRNLEHRLRADPGQSMVEYGIVVALIAIIAMAAIQAFGQGISQVFQQLLSQISSLGA